MEMYGNQWIFMEIRLKSKGTLHDHREEPLLEQDGGLPTALLAMILGLCETIGHQAEDLVEQNAADGEGDAQGGVVLFCYLHVS